ncbi:MAG: hypothetical protein BWY68_00902 [bacterium ADurb.Bin400]|nr:MAG: hypothetical protein BWY68_00902 [bacterium ADurb.Bin400]
MFPRIMVIIGALSAEVRQTGTVLPCLAMAPVKQQPSTAATFMFPLILVPTGAQKHTVMTGGALRYLTMVRIN